MTRTGSLDRVIARVRRPLDRIWLRRFARLSELERLRPAAPGGGRRVLILSLRAWPTHAVYESVIAQALRARGAEVAFVTCGGGQPVCELGRARHVHPRPCDRCAWFTDELVGANGVRGYRLADHVPWGGDARSAPGTPPPGAAVDPYDVSRVSVPWVEKWAAPPKPEDPVARDFAVSAAGVEQAAGRILDDFAPDVVMMVNGQFAMERTFFEVARARGIRTPTYEIAPHGDALVFSHDLPASKYETGEHWERIRETPLTPDQERALDEVLVGRAQGVGTHELGFAGRHEAVDEARRELGLRDGARTVSLFTNLSWDSATLYRDVAYPSMLEWAARAVEAAGERPEIDLVVRVHPAEVRWGTREAVEPFLRERFSALPPNVRIVPAASPLNTYALLGSTDLVLVYTTTTGVESAARAIPVAVAGQTHYRGRGFTFDLESHEDLQALLAQPGLAMTDEQRALARRYAYAFFLRLMIPFRHATPIGKRPQRVPTPAEIAPGADPYLDFICDRLLDGGPFFLPADRDPRSAAGVAA